MEKILKYSEIIQKQATQNIGCIGHVSEGKSTVVRKMTGIKTQKHKKEQERNITINLGYANFKVWRCSVSGKYFYTSSNIKKHINPENNNELTLIKHISFVDCPGHESFMATMISGTSVMNCAFLLIGANNSKVPQTQTYEHLIALNNTDVTKILILQNKLDLLDNEREAINNLEKIEDFVEGSIAENSHILPISAQLGINIDSICNYVVNELDDVTQNLNKDLRMPIIRSFDGNKPKTPYNKLTGGIMGVSIISGVLNVGTHVEIRPGILQNINGKIHCCPIITKVESIYSEKSSMDIAIPGGLLGIGTTMDPYICGSNRLIGQIVGNVGKMPEIYDKLNVNVDRIKRKDIKKESFVKGEIVMICINSFTNKATIKSIEGKNGLNLKLDKPVCCDIGQKFALLKKINGKYTLYSLGEILGGKEFKRITYNVNLDDYKIKDNIKYKIDFDINYEKEKFEPDYHELLNSFKFTKIESNTYSFEPLKLIRKPRQTIIPNMYVILKQLHNLEDTNFNYEYNYVNYFNEEIKKMCRFNDKKHFILNGKFNIGQIEGMVKNYMFKYVICPICKSNKTSLNKKDRLLKIICISCTAENCVSI